MLRIEVSYRGIIAIIVALAALWRRRRESRGWLLAVTLPFAGLWLMSTPIVAHLALGSVP